jgi:TatD DNase family protein
MAVAYAYDGVLYLAVTRRCTLACTFCPKMHGRWTVAGNDMSRDPELDADAIWAAAEQVGLAGYRDVAFVGLGESTMRLDVVVDLGKRLRAAGHRVRLVTDGLANLRAGADVTPRLAGAIDEVSVSLNAQDPAAYVRICPSKYGEAAHGAACDFLRAVKAHVPVVTASVIDMPEVDLDACRRLADDLGVNLRVRPWFDPEEGEPHGPIAVPE